jgi:hypothetical protein
MFYSALRTLKAHRVGPDESQGRIVNVKLEINGLSDFRAQTDEIAHRVAGFSRRARAFLELRPHMRATL